MKLLNKAERAALKSKIMKQMEVLRNSARIGGLPVKVGVRQRHYPFSEMKPGDYFFVHNEGRTTAQTNNSLQSSCAAFRQRTGCQFATFRMMRGVVVWRIA